MGRIIRICDRLAEKAIRGHRGEIQVPGELAGRDDLLNELIHQRIAALASETNEDHADGTRLGPEQERRFLEMLVRRLENA